jgi:hypothetical protein
LRNLFVLLWISATILFAASIPKAQADVDGDTAGPGGCSYPAIGAFGLDGVAQHYVCDYPTEINGSKHHCVYGGAAALVGANFSLLIFSASIATNIGVLEGICYWACPDGSVAAEPNPVQTWQGSAGQTAPVRRNKCTPIADNPLTPEPVPPQLENGPVLPQQQTERGQR